MERADIYRDIARRTCGDVYVGVVGPVRTGKSTFIKRFMDLMVLPGIEDKFARQRITDELPQSGAGRTIMTTQPRFVPSAACEITLGECASVRVRLVDCVGYMTGGALGFDEEDAPRMVRTPWSEDEMPFEQAAELGTRKVITEHSTIGIVVTTDGSITGIERESYVQAEERVVRELREQGKPFVVVLNSSAPSECGALRDSLHTKYDVPVLALDVLNMSGPDMASLFECVLFEFPMAAARFETPGWIRALGDEHWLTREIYEALGGCMCSCGRMRDYAAYTEAFENCEHFCGASVQEISLGTGEVVYELNPADGLFYKVLSEQSGADIDSDFKLMTMMRELVQAKQEYDRISGALACARGAGYGMVPPDTAELELEQPELIRRGSQYGVKLRARGPSLHILRADVACEVAPIVGSEQQGEEMVKSMIKGYEDDPSTLWEVNIFGKSLRELMTDGVSAKLGRVPETAQRKLAHTLGRIVNDGSGNLICILF